MGIKTIATNYTILVYLCSQVVLQPQFASHSKLYNMWPYQVHIIAIIIAKLSRSSIMLIAAQD